MTNRERSGRTLPCFLALHRREHCFGFFGTEGSDIEPSLGRKTLYECRSCTNPDTRILLEVAEGRSDAPKSHLYVSDRFAFCNGMDEGDELILRQITSATVCNRIVIEPATVNDYEILQCSRNRVELVFLDQLRFVAEGMLFPIWVERNVCIVFRVVSIDPPISGHVVRLSNNTEVEISWPTSTAKSDSSLASPPVKSEKSLPKDILSSLSAGSPLDAMVSHCDFPNGDVVVKPTSLRVLFHNFFEEGDAFGVHNVVVSVCPQESGSVPKFQIVEVEREEVKTCAVWIRVPSGVCSDFYRHLSAILVDRKTHCIISNNLRSAGFADGFRLHVKPFLKKNCVLLTRLTVVPSAEVNQNNLSEAIQQYFLSSYACVTDFCVMDVNGLKLNLNISGQSLSVLLKPTPECAAEGLSTVRRCFIFSKARLPSFEFESGQKEESYMAPEEPKPSEHDAHSYGSRKPKLKPLLCQSLVVSRLTSKIAFSLSAYGIPGNTHHHLITGPRLSGKTTLLRLLAVELERHSLTVFSKYIDCFSWKGKSPETIEKRLNAAIRVLNNRQPSLLLLDNIDFFNLKNEGEERVIPTEKVFFVIRESIEKSGVLVCASARNSRQVNKILMNAQGKRFFCHSTTIGAPDQNERYDVLSSFYPSLEQNRTEAVEIAKNMENFTIGDIRRVIDLAKIEASMNGRCEEVLVDDLRGVIEEFRPISVEISKADATGEVKVDWNDVGGMKSVKQLMSEVLLWPSKYADLFERCGLRLGRGVMLHGPSGCGKTLMAQATATESRMNFIQVKGPELLSKYIGASEENVRNVFERAKKSRPCLIFFDEFDALAPRRGHDSTGVTDRVVNQLLTELDGADQLEGVFVIAATSRLDLIDPALLRPGRFDHIVECTFPDWEERKEILRIVCSKVHIESPKMLVQIARETSGWTGAQLRGLITNAQFDALRDNPSYVNDKLVVRREDLEKSFEDGLRKMKTKAARAVAARENGWQQQEQRIRMSNFKNVRGGSVTLNSGFDIPLIGLGTYKIRGDDVPKAVDGALAAGYRMFDTAKYYLNEKEFGDALEALLPKYGLQRSDVFLTTKFFPEPENNTEGARRLVLESLANLKTDYLDLVLVHYPKANDHENDNPVNPKNRRDAYVELEKMKKEGIIRSVGVSNFEKRHLEEMTAYQENVPSVNQMEFHPHFIRPEAKKYCDENGIFFQAFSSLGRHQPELINEQVVKEIAEKHETTVELILLAFAVCQRVGIVPKSTNTGRIASNMKAADIHLSEREIASLNALNKDQHYIRCTGWQVL